MDEKPRPEAMKKVFFLPEPVARRILTTMGQGGASGTGADIPYRDNEGEGLKRKFLAVSQ